jgi:hypothetical protein
MIYLNFILTVLCLILLSFLVCIILFWKKYGKNIIKLSQNNPFMGKYPVINDSKQMEDSMKLIGNLFKTLNNR